MFFSCNGGNREKREFLLLALLKIYDQYLAE